MKGLIIQPIEIGKTGKITSGDDTGHQIKIIDDSENTGGFLILSSKDFNDPNEPAFDDWVAGKNELEDYFEESNWVISWI